MFRNDMKNVIEPVTISKKDDSEDLTKTMMVTSIENNKQLAESQSLLRSVVADINNKLSK